ncbi:MAG: hypothetical protein HY866_23470 [Chloroflexi bacterium]|nr:hypothetical protein [Chloroflexota bacterium]
MTKTIIIPDFKYKSPKRRGRGTGHQGLRATLKYLQFREDRDTRANQEKLRDRWQDRGLGKHYREIFTNCDCLQSQHVLAWTWVISPAPDLMALVPEVQRRDLVMDVTERIVEAYYEARGFQMPPYAYVVHDRLTKEGEQQLHSHVILPGLAPTVEGWEAIYNHKRKRHEQLFNTIAHDEFEVTLDRTIGTEWRREIEEPAVEAQDVPEDIDSLDAWFPR